MNNKNIASIQSKRKEIHQFLKGGVAYLRLKENSKLPAGKYAKKSRNRLKNPPKDGNFGIIPESDIFILDIDCHTKDSMPVEEQVQFFSKLFNVDLSKTFAVLTPSGGRHYYLRFHNHVLSVAKKYKLPKASLRYLNSHFEKVLDNDLNIAKSITDENRIQGNLNLDADIRTGLVNGYVVAPGSVIDGIEYTVLNDTANIIEVSELAIKKLDAVVRSKKSESMLQKRSELIEKSKLRNQANTGFDYPEFSVEDGEDILNKPTAHSISALRVKLDQRKKEDSSTRFHTQRAFVKAALHCCYSDYAIALACVELGIDTDTFTSDRISFKQLYKDICRITPVEKYHGNYCQKGKILRLEKREKNRAESIADLRKAGIDESDFNLGIFLDSLKKKVEDGSLSKRNRNTRIIDPRVIDVEKVVTSLLGENHSLLRTARDGKIFHTREKQDKTLPSQFWNAIEIVDYYIQPLVNVGAKFIMLAKSSIMDKLGFSDSQATQALRVLRKSGLIYLERRQRTGVPALYGINDSFIDDSLTRALRKAWGRSKKVNQDYLIECVGKTGSSTKEEKKLDHLPIYFDRFSSSFRDVFSNSFIKSDLDRISTDTMNQRINVKMQMIVSGVAKEGVFSEDIDSRNFKKLHPSEKSANMSELLILLKKIEQFKSPKSVNRAVQDHGSGAAKYYLKEEREMLGIIIVEDLCIIERTGEIFEAAFAHRIGSIEDRDVLNTEFEEDFEIYDSEDSSDFACDTDTGVFDNEELMILSNFIDVSELFQNGKAPPVTIHPSILTLT